MIQVDMLGTVNIQIAPIRKTRIAEEIAERVRYHIPGEQEKRHGQAIAAASLPALHNQEA